MDGVVGGQGMESTGVALHWSVGVEAVRTTVRFAASGAQQCWCCSGWMWGEARSLATHAGYRTPTTVTKGQSSNMVAPTCG